MQVLLVGGFALSPYLQAQVRHGLLAEAGEHLHVIVPNLPHAAVLQGGHLASYTASHCV
jgi:hypothetical protein